MTSPYQPPKASVADMERVPGSPIKGVVFGVLVDIGGSLALGVVISILYGIVLVASGASQEEMERILASPDPLSWASIVGNMAGFGMSFLGGYVCARVAGKYEYRWAGIVAAVAGVVGLLFGMATYPVEWNLLLALLSVGAVMGGAWTVVRAKERKKT
jgi:hypothetical protein